MGEVLVRLVACGVCHIRPLHGLRGPIPRATRRPFSATKAPASSNGSATASASLAPGDHVVTLFSPQCREMRPPVLSPRTNLCLAIREQQQNPGLPARWHDPPRPRRRADPATSWASTFAEYTVMPEIALAKVDPDAPFEHARALRLWPLDRAGRGDVHRQGRGGLDLLSSSARAWSGSARSPAAGCRAPSRSFASISPKAGSSWRAGRARRRCWPAARTLSSRFSSSTGGLGADYTFRGDRPPRTSCRQAVESYARMGWEPLHDRRRRRGRARRSTSVPRYLITRPPRVRLVVFGGVKGRDQVPDLVRLSLDGRLDVAPFISTHADTRRGQPRLRADGGPGRHPQRHRVQFSRRSRR